MAGRGFRGNGAPDPGVRVEERGGGLYPVEARTYLLVRSALAAGANGQAMRDAIAVGELENARAGRKARQFRRHRQGRLAADGPAGAGP